jgi:hypothetical protein
MSGVFLFGAEQEDEFGRRITVIAMGGVFRKERARRILALCAVCAKSVALLHVNRLRTSNFSQPKCASLKRNYLC